MLEISARLEEALNRVFIKVFPQEDRSSKTSSVLTGSNLVPASKPEFGDFQINCALSLAKEIKRPPRDIAQQICLLYTSPSPRDVEESRMPSSA